MKEEKHRKLTKQLVDSFGGSGIDNILSAVILFSAVAIFVSSSLINASSKAYEIGKLILMSSAFLMMILAFMYRKISKILNQVNKTQLSFKIKIVSATFTLYFYGVAIGLLTKL